MAVGSGILAFSASQISHVVDALGKWLKGWPSSNSEIFWTCSPGNTVSGLSLLAFYNWFRTEGGKRQKFFFDINPLVDGSMDVHMSCGLQSPLHY